MTKDISINELQKFIKQVIILKSPKEVFMFFHDFSV